MAEAFTQVVDEAKTDLVLIVDEVQECLGREDAQALMQALKAARDAINLRQSWLAQRWHASQRKSSLTVGLSWPSPGTIIRPQNIPPFPQMRGTDYEVPSRRGVRRQPPPAP